MAFLAVDLEVRGRPRLEPVLAALEPHVIIQRYTRASGRSHASFSLGGAFDTQDVALRRWMKVLGALRGRARTVLRECTVVASIGVDADDGHSTEVVVAPRLVGALARLGVGIEVVVYRAQARPRPARPR